MTLSALALVLHLLGFAPRVEPPIFWESRGPAYTSVDVVVAGADDDTVYAAARDAESGASALFRTTDGGNHWDLLAPAPEGERIRQVVIDPTDPRRMLALTALAAGVRIYRSDDAGATWRLKTSLAEGDGSESLFFDPAHPDLAFLDAWNSDLNARVLSSSLEDGPWSPIAYDPTASSAWIAPDGTVIWTARVEYCSRIPCYPGSTIYWLDVIRFSENEGQTLQGDAQEVFCLGMNVTYDPSNPSLAYGSGFSCPDLLRSEDGGKTWAQWDPSGSLGRLIHGYPGRRIAGTAISTSGAPALYALALATTSSDTGGLLVSHDGGWSWGQLPNPGGSVTAMAVGPSGTLYVGTSTGVFRAGHARTIAPRSR
jgi:hypothetical protein